jgi:hypothetical protein
MVLEYYMSSAFLYNATTNVFNVIALLSAILLILDPVVFVLHTGYSFYLHEQARKAADEKASAGPSASTRAKGPPRTDEPQPAWWKWYAVSATIHLLDAWFFRSIIPFFERVRSAHYPGDGRPDDLQDLADISRLLWGIVRALSLFVITLEVWEKRLVLKTVLGQHWKNPKWGFAISYFLSPAIVAVSGSPVVVYFAFLAVWNSAGFFWSVIKQAFKPDWRRTQDVFVQTATKVVTVVKSPTATKPVWKFWE